MITGRKTQFQSCQVSVEYLFIYVLNPYYTIILVATGPKSSRFLSITEPK